MFPNICGVTLYPCPRDLKQQYDYIFTKGSLQFLSDIVNQFDNRIDELYAKRLEIKSKISQGWTPKFETSKERSDKSWKIDPLPERLLNRHVDLGDVSPSNTAHFVDSLNANVQGVQVDFDDGHCPTWRNTIQGIYNVCMAVKGDLPGAPVELDRCPVLMLRPRAWNMFEHHCIVNGKVLPGPLFDFSMLMYHCGQKLMKKQCGPYFYLSKIEGPNETTLWNDIFIWTQQMLNIKRGTIKACVLIENICAVFALDEILFSLKEHSLGLNCGIWDYSASIITKFGDRKSFVIPDRNKYVNMEKPFLANYMKLVLSTCQARGAPATAGMAALLIKDGKSSKISKEIVDKVIATKAKEIEIGFDGFLIYDLGLVPYINELWKKQEKKCNMQISDIKESDLLNLPKGGVTFEGLLNNIKVSLLFIYHWFEGVGHFYLNGAVEDSATAEICRSQIWQWIRHSVEFDDEDVSQREVNFQIVVKLLDKISNEYSKTLCKSKHDLKRMSASKFLLQEIVLSRDFPEFITSFLNDNHKFRALHNKSESLFSKL